MMNNWEGIVSPVSSHAMMLERVSLKVSFERPVPRKLKCSNEGEMTIVVFNRSVRSAKRRDKKFNEGRRMVSLIASCNGSGNSFQHVGREEMNLDSHVKEVKLVREFRMSRSARSSCVQLVPSESRINKDRIHEMR